MAILALPRALDAPAGSLRDIGPKTAKLLGKLGIKTVRDLLLTLPFGWEVYTDSPIAALVPGTQATVVGTIVSIQLVTTRRKGIRIVEAAVADDSGAQMRAAWFHSEF